MLKKLVASGCAAALLAAVPATTAQATTPQPSEWTYADETYALPAGVTCKDKVIEKAKYAYRVTEYPDGRAFIEYKDWSTTTFVNTRNRRTYTIPAGGDIFITPSGETTEYIKLVGDNYILGKGVKGLLFTKGYVTFKVVNIGDPLRETILNLDLSKAQKVIEVCAKLGSTPVQGSNPPGEPIA